MSTTVLREIDGALLMSVPEDVAEELHLQPGTSLDLHVEDGHLVARPARRRQSLSQLLEEHSRIIEELGENREWVDAPAVGRELI